MENYKPRVMVELEKKGWTWITNVNLKNVVIREMYVNGLTVPEVAQCTEKEVVEHYKSRGFGEVLVTDAFDRDGNYMPRDRDVAVYVKGRPDSKAKRVSRHLALIVDEDALTLPHDYGHISL